MDQIKIVPKPGVLVPLHDGHGMLPAEGKMLTLNSYWYQRQSDGDVTFEDVAESTEVVSKAKSK